MALLLAIVGHMALAGCAMLGGGQGGHGQLQRSIQLYIDGDYAQAVETLLPLTATLERPEDVLAAYLYLGRSYMALGDFVAAADALSAGRALGGGVEFDELLVDTEQAMRSESDAMRRQPSLSRAQFAALLDRFMGGTETRVLPSDLPADVAGHWSRGHVANVMAAGIMLPLPDGAFHPDDIVTRAAFYVTLRRAVLSLNLDGRELALYLAPGYRHALLRGDAYISGAEATDVLQTLEPSTHD